MLQVRAEPGYRSLVLTPGLEHAGGDEGVHEASHGGFGLHERLGLGGFVVLLVFFHHLDRAQVLPRPSPPESRRREPR